jgi:hypothetical protein
MTNMNSMCWWPHSFSSLTQRMSHGSLFILQLDTMYEPWIYIHSPNSYNVCTSCWFILPPQPCCSWLHAVLRLVEWKYRHHPQVNERNAPQNHVQNSSAQPTNEQRVSPLFRKGNKRQSEVRIIEEKKGLWKVNMLEYCKEVKNT